LTIDQLLVSIQLPNWQSNGCEADAEDSCDHKAEKGDQKMEDKWLPT